MPLRIARSHRFNLVSPIVMSCMLCQASPNQLFFAYYVAEWMDNQCLANTLEHHSTRRLIDNVNRCPYSWSLLCSLAFLRADWRKRVCSPLAKCDVPTVSGTADRGAKVDFTATRLFSRADGKWQRGERDKFEVRKRKDWRKCDQTLSGIISS